MSRKSTEPEAKPEPAKVTAEMLNALIDQHQYVLSLERGLADERERLRQLQDGITAHRTSDERFCSPCGRYIVEVKSAGSRWSNGGNCFYLATVNIHPLSSAK